MWFTTFVKFIRLFELCFYYCHILAVLSFHKAMREEDSEKNGNTEQRVVFILVKVAVVTIALSFMATATHGVMGCMGLFKCQRSAPLNAMWVACFDKPGDCSKPIFYDLSHPKLRTAVKDGYECYIYGKFNDGKPSENFSQSNGDEFEPKALTDK